MKRLIISSLITFFAGFALVVVPAIDQLTIESFKTGAIVGLLFAGARTGLKMVLEAFIAWYQNDWKNG